MIRKLETNDIKAAMEIWLESTVQAHPFLDRKYWEDNYKVVEEVYIPHAETFVYEDGNEIKGFISIIEEQFIGALFIKCDSQGKGIGSQLLDAVVDKYRDIQLAVYKENCEAVGFYQAKGFQIIAEQDNEETKVREYIMQKK